MIFPKFPDERDARRVQLRVEVERFSDAVCLAVKIFGVLEM